MDLELRSHRALIMNEHVPISFKQVFLPESDSTKNTREEILDNTRGKNWTTLRKAL